MSIKRYVLVDKHDNEDDYEYDVYMAAYEAARKRNMAVVERTYVYEDSSLIWTPDGSDTWPPK